MVAWKRIFDIFYISIFMIFLYWLCAYFAMNSYIGTKHNTSVVPGSGICRYRGVWCGAWGERPPISMNIQFGKFDQISTCNSFIYLIFYFIVNWFLSILLPLGTGELVYMWKRLVKNIVGHFFECLPSPPAPPPRRYQKYAQKGSIAYQCSVKSDMFITWNICFFLIACTESTDGKQP